MPSGAQAFWLSRLTEADAYTRWTYSQFAAYLGERVLEVGCGTGNFTTLVAAAVERVYAIEVESDFVDQTRERTRCLGNVEVRHGDVRTLAGTERYDSVLMLDVLEHIEDDVGLLVTLREFLEPDGHLIVKVPAIPAIYNRMDRLVGHFRRYDRSGLESVLRRAGYGIERTWGFNLAGVPGWWLTGSVFGSAVPSPESIRTFNRFVPVLRWAERLLGPSTGLSLFSVASPVSRPDPGIYCSPE